MSELISYDKDTHLPPGLAGEEHFACFRRSWQVDFTQVFPQGRSVHAREGG